MSNNQAADAVMRIQMDNLSKVVADPHGDMPKCKPKLYTHVCERCGRNQRKLWQQQDTTEKKWQTPQNRKSLEYWRRR